MSTKGTQGESGALQSRLKYLRAIELLSSGKNAQIKLVDNLCLTASSVAGVNADASIIIVTGLETTLGVLPSATLRGSDVVSLEVDIAKGDAE